MPHRTGKSPGFDSRRSEHEKGDGACEDDTEFLLDGDFDDEISLVSSEKSESEAESEEEAQPVELMFKMSFESDRVYLYNSVSKISKYLSTISLSSPNHRECTC